MELWEHQRAGVERIGAGRPYLAWDMGTGKSRAVVAAIDRFGYRRTLIVCPKSVIGVWPREFMKACSGVRVVQLGAGPIQRRVDEARRHWHDEPGVVYVTNHEAVWREPMGSAFERADWDLLVVDEAHRAKSPVGRLSHYLVRIGRRARNVVALSGTPMPHSPLDIFAQMRFLRPSVLGHSYVMFRSRYAVMGGYQGKQVVAYRNMDELQTRLEPVMHVVRADDVLDLPDCTHTTISVEMPPAARRIYRTLEQELVAQIEAGGGYITAANAMVLLLRLQQVAAGTVTTESGRSTRVHDAKADALAELLAEDTPADEPVVVFARFRPDLDAIHEASARAGRTSVELSGRRRDIGAVWTPHEPGEVAAVQVQSGGVGIDLTASALCIYYSGTWSLGDFDQSLARVRRPGQTRPVRYVHLVADGTVDETIVEALEKRRSIVESVIDAIRAGSRVTDEVAV